MSITTDGKVKSVFGGLLGQNRGNIIEINSAFEFFNSSIDAVNLDLTYIDERKKLTEQLYPNLELLGYFVTNECTDCFINAELTKAMDYFGVVSPICLVLSTNLEGVEVLPIAVYEVDKTSATRIDHIVEGGDSERICLDTITTSTDFQNNESAMIQNMMTVNNASDVLKANLITIKEALKQEAFKNDAVFNSLLDVMVRNYPDAESVELKNMLSQKEEELMMLNNICAGSIVVSHQGRVDAFNKPSSNK